MEPLDVDGVEGVLDDLEPVAGDDGESYLPDGVLFDEQVPPGQQRRGLGAHVREYEPTDGLHRIGG